MTNNSTTQGKSLLVLAALGVVFGDIATSPLYAIRECFSGEHGIAPSHENVLGILSLMSWSLIVIVSLKYLVLILRADSGGEGGVLVLSTLACPPSMGRRGRSHYWLWSLGLFAACLLYGDGVITPAISVLSAVEGLQRVSPALNDWILPITVTILVLLFASQRFGTAKVGFAFGPIIALWLLALAVSGGAALLQNPQVLAALNPWHGFTFLTHNGLHGFTVLGAVFLVVTGAEAMYADLGHFGKGPIRRAWFLCALPALLLNYFGQGANLLAHPEDAGHPFYALIPDAIEIPFIIFATLATIIASQAIISGAFSLTRQAIRLGLLPRLRVIHTSEDHEGQIYLPLVNWLLMIVTIAVVVGFRSSSNLASAYGVAVSATMLVSTLLLFVVVRQKWGWRFLPSALLCGLFALIDLTFFSANMMKLFHGAWFPLVTALLVYLLMMSWKIGRQAVTKKSKPTPLTNLSQVLADSHYESVPGKVLFLATSPQSLPLSFLENLRYNKIVHQHTTFLHIATAQVPRVSRDQKVTIEDLGNGFTQIIAHYGFMESPNVPHILAIAREQGGDYPLDEVSFFLGGRNYHRAKHSHLPGWAIHLYCFLARNSESAARYYAIPAEQTLEQLAPIEL